ncbi:hypothetical protein FOZ63_009378 [Perkinsus olseni]|uniref:Uncharacterized protein n=1 Tax=Perkinsus olseni TaxID=32597 RepID=A0A7J6R7B9_PEROL|nr:hypothetical protein FOZ63_009378 [Perkinsus olseni]KAF4716302.1 hypothetical protein FOZ62_027368 [Perkinsus olseni]
MDDIVIQGAEVEGIVRAFALLFAILRILGFVAQCDKLWAVVRPGNEEQFRQYCEGYGVVVPLSTEGTLLGIGTEVVGGCGVFELHDLDKKQCIRMCGGPGP